ncbi:MAG: cation:proton antiporter [Patescibacteria group bacterium]
MADNIFLNISILLALTVSIAFIMRLLRQPLVVAYLIAGLIAGPFFLNLTHEGDALFQSFAQFGIVLLLFIIGLNLNVEYIKTMGRHAFVGGTVQFIATAGTGWIVMRLFHIAPLPSIFIAIALTFSSTVIITKLLSEKKDLDTVYGRFSVGLLILQDIIAILLLVLLTSITDGGNIPMEILRLSLFGLLIGVLLYTLSRFVLPRVMAHIAASGELLFLFTIAWCFGIASVVWKLGFGAEIGAVIAGLSLGSTPYQREIVSKVKPLRDFFIVIFFIVLGSELHSGFTREAVAPAIVLSLFVLIIDPFILYGVMRWLGYTRRNAFLAGITAAQVSEFGFILMFQANELGLVGESEMTIVTITALITIIISSYCITHNESLYHLIRPILERLGPDYAHNEERVKETYDAWVIGYHRMGWKVCDALAEKGISYAVVDYNP